MSLAAESGPAYKGPVVQPLLMQCDLYGRVVWMSSYTRSVLGEPSHLAEIVTFSAGLPQLSLWTVWQSGDTLIVGAQPIEPGGDASGGLSAVQDSLLGHFFRLLIAERQLFRQVRYQGQGGGRKAIRQVEMERQRLGRELHTGAGQMLAAIRMQLEVIAHELPAPPQHVQQALERIGLLAGDTLDQVRSISKRMHPPEWQRLTLRDAIQQLWEISGVPERFESALEMDPLPEEPDLEVKVLLYRTMQEALSNLIRHSKATQVVAALRLEGRRLTLSVRDNGVGFDAERLARGPVRVGTGIGLRSVREQAESLGGKMNVESGPSGTKLVVSVGVSPTER